jgi:vitamin B12 transporter
MSIVTRRTIAASALVLSATLAHAQSEPGPDIVVTPTRTAQPIQRAGSAVTVISADEIERSSVRDVGDLLRRSPGVDVVQAGGPGQITTVRLRGGDVRHTLVLVDGIRVNDPSSTGREFDFANLALADIERIEVLRGPQSALYGSDAMGGVINVITRKGGTTPRATVSVEGGSYGTKEVRATLSGGNDKVDYSFGFSGFDTAGFSAYGYRIRRLAYIAPWGFEPDSDKRLGFAGRIGINIADGVRLEIGGSTTLNRAQYDAAFYHPLFSPFPDTPSLASSQLHNVYARLIADSFGGVLKNTVTVFANRTDRLFESVTYGPGGVFCNGSFYLARGIANCRSDTQFIGDRVGAEYQGDVKLGAFGLFTVGARIEREQADGFSRTVVPASTPWARDFAGEQTTRSLFALHQFSIGDRLHLSIGGRFDDVVSPDRFVGGATGGSQTLDRIATWRATAAYELRETDTKLRASIGTGGKVPSLYQLYGTYGTPTLQSERSVGVDAGVDQMLAGGRVKLSGTVFANWYKDLIDFDTNPADCRPGQFFGCYFNMARAYTSGLELSGDVMFSDAVRLRMSYTHLRAVGRSPDPMTGILGQSFELARRPRDQGRIGLAFTPVAGVSIEPAVVFVGDRFSSPNETDRLAPYARLDVYASYKLNETFSLYGRAENLSNTRYEEVRNYGTAGRSFYAGVRATW